MRHCQRHFQIENLKFLGDDTGSSSNPFKRLAAKNADSTWVKTETEVKSEKSEEKNLAPDATSEDDKKEILTGEEEEKNVLQINAKLFQVSKIYINFKILIFFTLLISSTKQISNILNVGVEFYE